MRRTHGAAIVSALVVGAMVISIAPGSAHKPVTSPYTYNDDVYPILRDRCGQCHVPDGVAPMSLMTHDDTVPWGESIRVELLAGRMPPWSVDEAPGEFRNIEPMTGREMNVVLTWATGGTPLGNPDKVLVPPPTDRAWPLGEPDLVLPFPTEHTLPAGEQEDTVDLVIPTGTTEHRWVRAADLLPGTPSIVRGASIQVKSAAPSTSEHGLRNEPVMAAWLPGDTPVALDGGSAFELPAGAELAVRVHYKKTWQYERKEMSDRSTVGLYFAPDPATAVRAVTLTASRRPVEAGTISGVVFGRAIDADVRALAIYPGEELSDAAVVVTAVEPSGARKHLIAFRPRAGWARRYWFRQPVPLPRGTRLEAMVTFGEETALLPLATTAPSQVAPPGPATIQLTLNVIPAS